MVHCVESKVGRTNVLNQRAPRVAIPGNTTLGRRMYVDCSQTFVAPMRSGIPRVVRNIIKHGRAAAAQHNLILTPVRFEDGFFIPVEISAGGDIIGASVNQVRREHPVVRRMRKLLYPKAIVRAAQTAWRRLLRAAIPPTAVRFMEGDTLLLADSSWSVNFWSEIDAARCLGTRIGLVQYDFIPHTHPHFTSVKLTKVFRRWMKKTLQSVDFIAAISETVADQTRSFLSEINRDVAAKTIVRSFRLGADLNDESDSRPPSLRPELVAFIELAQRGPYLTVGTVEPRKNQGLLLDSFEKVWTEAPDAKLLVAGFAGWHSEAAVERFRRHPRWKTHILYFPNLSDAELRYAYSRSKALLFPSHAEGYGLPVVEALRHQMPVFASDILVHRQVGGDCCVYFSPFDSQALASQIIGFERTGLFPAAKQPGNFDTPTWLQAVQELIDISLGSLTNE